MFLINQYLKICIKKRFDNKYSSLFFLIEKRHHIMACLTLTMREEENNILLHQDTPNQIERTVDQCVHARHYTFILIFENKLSINQSTPNPPDHNLEHVIELHYQPDVY